MKKEIIGNQTLYLGDCLEIIPTLGTVDAVVTDPPFGTQDLGRGYGRRQLHSINGRDGRIIKNDKDLSVLAGFMQKIPLENGFALVFYAPRKIKEFLEAIEPHEYVGEIIWDKKQMGLGYTVRYSHESIAVIKFGENPRPLFAIDSIIEAHQQEKIHPHQKPVSLLKKLVSWQAGNVLDPFMGSGTTLVACQQMGRHGIGIEISKEYFDIACQRVHNAYMQPDLFIDN